MSIRPTTTIPTMNKEGEKNMPYAGIAQGNTTNASDCNVFYNGMKLDMDLLMFLLLGLPLDLIM